MVFIEQMQFLCSFLGGFMDSYLRKQDKGICNF